MDLAQLDWKSDADKGKDVFRAKLDPGLLVNDITGLFTVDEHDYSPSMRLTRARYPNGNWEQDMWGLCR